MANSLLITKLSDDSFSFVVNGDTVNTIINLRNDMTTVGNECHFKTSNGANLIKLQQILYNEVTIVDGSALPVATSPLDLRLKLISVGFWDWLFTGGIGVNRFDNLLDTFDYFGNDGKIPMVDESQLKLVPYSLPSNLSYLNLFPTPLLANKGLKVNSLATAYEFYDIVNLVTQDIRQFYTDTTPSEDAVYNALTLKLNISDVPNSVPKIQFSADGTTSTYDIGVLAQIKAVFWEGALLDDADWSQTGSQFTLTFIPPVGNRIKPI